MNTNEKTNGSVEPRRLSFRSMTKGGFAWKLVALSFLVATVTAAGTWILSKGSSRSSVPRLVGHYMQKELDRRPYQYNAFTIKPVASFLLIYADPSDGRLSAVDTSENEIFYARPDGISQKVGAYTAEWQFSETKSTSTSARMQGKFKRRIGLDGLVLQGVTDEKVTDDFNKLKETIANGYKTADFDISLMPDGAIERTIWYNGDDTVKRKTVFIPRQD